MKSSQITQKNKRQILYLTALFIVIFFLNAAGCSAPQTREEASGGAGETREPGQVTVAASQTPEDLQADPSATAALVPTAMPVSTGTPTEGSAQSNEQGFNGERALEDVAYQLALGPRTPGSPGHDQIVSWMQEELSLAGWAVEVQETTAMDHPVQNVIGRRGNGQPWIILGAHYDTRMVADQDPDPEKAKQPVPGANDGASGVAVLLELARTLPEDLEKQIWLVFFDVEDNGSIAGWNWILGSSAFVEGLEANPDAAVIVDMIGDADLQIYKERNSDPQLTGEIWEVAASLGYNQFKFTSKHAMLDDHTPFLQAGIVAVDIIDFDYPYWHTSEDTLDKVSAESLMAVGDTLFTWLVNP